jgi:hypothetical protein
MPCKCRRDECDRVKMFGARVLTLDQVYGVKDPSMVLKKRMEVTHPGCGHQTATILEQPSLEASEIMVSAVILQGLVKCQNLQLESTREVVALQLRRQLGCVLSQSLPSGI